MYPEPVNRTTKSNSLASAPGNTRGLFLATAFRMILAVRCGLVTATFMKIASSALVSKPVAAVEFRICGVLM